MPTDAKPLHDSLLRCKLLDNLSLLALVRSDYYILDCGAEHASTIVRILHLLANKDESIHAFQHIRNHATRKAVLGRLTPKSRAHVEKALEQAKAANVKRGELTPYLFHRLPTEMWDIIRSKSSQFCVGLLSTHFLLHPPSEISSQLLWYSIFQDERWLNHVTENGGEPGLLLLDGQSRVTLLLHNRRGLISRRLFFDSLRPHTRMSSGYEVTVGTVCLNIAVLLDHPYLEPSTLENSKNAGYLFWTDEQRRLTKIEARDIKTLKEILEFYLVRMQLEAHGKVQTMHYVFHHDKIYWPSMNEDS